MGAGEQRVFEIVKIVSRCENYALILIDEIDLLLHGDALNRLLKILNDYAVNKNLQIIFTTHREQVLQLTTIISVRHIYQTPIAPHKTFCFIETKPDAITRLTGEHHRPLRLACEDRVAEAIVEKIATQIGVRRFVEITKFGSAKNCFTLAAALILSGEDLTNALFVLDGDEYETDEKKQAQIGKVLTGTEADSRDKRENVLVAIRQFCPSVIQCPEKSLHDMIISVPKIADLENADVIEAALQIANVDDEHDWVNKIIENLGCSREVGLTRIVSVAARSQGWDEYVSSVREWLMSKAPDVQEQV